MVITEGAEAAAKEMEFALVGAAQGTGKKEYPSKIMLLQNIHIKVKELLKKKRNHMVQRQ